MALDVPVLDITNTSFRRDEHLHLPSEQNRPDLLRCGIYSLGCPPLLAMLPLQVLQDNILTHPLLSHVRRRLRPARIQRFQLHLHQSKPGHLHRQHLANIHVPVLGRILYYVPHCSPLHPGRVLTTFGLLSAIVEALNAIGVAYIANPSVPETATKLGHILMKTSLILQLLVIACFCALTWTFQRRCRRAGIVAGKGKRGNKRVFALLATLYASMFVILGRCVYRTVEHFGFSDISGGKLTVNDPATLSPLVRHEWFFYVFEAALMAVNSVLWNVRHPHRYLPERYETYLTRDGVTELVGPGWRDERPFIVTVCDPFGWFVSKGGEGKEGGKPFWETDGYGLEGKKKQHGGHGLVSEGTDGISLLTDPGAGAATAV
ncbi:hypothetical protein EMCG_08594 [[Emmonsia] crescens]|uniref:RTA1 domain-containing protein n=1 Tax=[Emmonsia] crescens TaxID=73230 RepID=A0A0G2J456_9EURO|nr:hypothetical protein EMCG_08594 [Emmonsia crescens UAMH 3008]